MATGGALYFLTMAAVSHLDMLNSAQRKAATYGEPNGEHGWRSGPLLIVAGAGTGKTSTIAHRVAELVLHGVDPARILLLTFTRRRIWIRWATRRRACCSG